MIRKSTQVAMGGIASGLCLLLMMMTMMVPFSTFIFPALAGILLIAVAYENGTKTAWMVYFAVAILSLIVVPDKEAAMLFIGFFGYYPILKPALEKLKNKYFKTVLKFLIFNVSILASYLVIIHIFGIADMLEEVGVLGQYSMLVMAVMLNVLFVSIDIAISRITFTYIYWFRPKFLRKVK